MKTLRVVPVLLLSALLAGCAATRESSRSESPTETNAAAQRDAAISARAAQYMKSGSSQREAYAKAESDYDGTLTPLRKLEPSRRGL